MRWQAAVIAVLGVALGTPAFAQSGEELPDGSKPDGKEVMPGSDEETNEEEDVDVLGLLEETIGNMKDAEQTLAKAEKPFVVKENGDLIPVDEMQKSLDLQKKAIEQMQRIFGGGQKEQQEAVETLEKLIKAAKEGS